MEPNRVAPLLDYWEKVRGRTRRVVDRIPEEHLEWSWKPGRFTLGDYVRHLAGVERWMYAENAMRRPSRYPGHAAELAKTGCRRCAITSSASTPSPWRSSAVSRTPTSPRGA